ncbi:MAG: hypothetical protein IKS21_06230, partial [Oscillospiraceae bacterium]|nr:hypothetical protein [Oscillospiraceae bacterium]
MQFAAGKSNVPDCCNAGRSPWRAIVCFANADEHCSSLHMKWKRVPLRDGERRPGRRDEHRSSGIRNECNLP